MLNKRARRAAAVFAALALLAGCSDGPGSSAGSGAATSSGKKKADGPFFAECAGVTPDELSQKLGAAGFRVQFRNSVSCQWQSMGGAVATFTWYRGSPIGRERAWENRTRDAVRDLTIRNYPGFLIQSSNLCEIGVDFGNDFIEWSVQVGRIMRGESECDGTRQLAELSVDRSQK